jgi:anti-sigma factor RsiW
MRTDQATCRRERQISLMVAGDLNPRQMGKIQAHMASCPSCQNLAQELKELRSWSTTLGGLEELVPSEFRTVSLAVRARLNQPAQQPASLWRPAWPVLAPLAGVVMMAAVLVLGGGRPAGPDATRIVSMRSANSTIIEVSPIQDASDALLSIQDGPDAVHQVAVSSHDPRFSNAKVFQVVGDRWIDPTPLPEPGQVIYYRVD